VLTGDYLTCGPTVTALEQKICEITGAKYAVSVCNGTAALHCACIAAGLGEGDEVITTPWDPKSIGNSTTLKEDTNNKSTISTTFRYLSKEVSSRAMKENKLGHTIQIVVKESDFKVHNKSTTIDNPTNNENTIYDVAMRLYEKNFSNMLHLKDEGNEQLSNIDSYIFQAKDFCHYTFSICMKDKSKNFIQQMLDVLKDMTSGAGMNR
jgi:hypothetical protein